MIGRFSVRKIRGKGLRWFTWRAKQNDFPRHIVDLQSLLHRNGNCDTGYGDEIVTTSVRDFLAVQGDGQRVHLGVHAQGSHRTGVRFVREFGAPSGRHYLVGLEVLGDFEALVGHECGEDVMGIALIMSIITGH